MKLDSMRVEGADNGIAAIEEDLVRLRANAHTDWFFAPSGKSRVANVTRVVREIDEQHFALSARVSVEFASPYDAGAIFIECDDNNWAKIAFEFSAARKPTIVSVVTRGTSDDSDGPRHFGEHVWLRAYCDGETIAFHFSEDGKYWNFLRWFTLPGVERRPVRIGLGVQSPTGEGTTAVFSDVQLCVAKISDLRNGQ
ncbi:DUF1349 domain-containing protein [Mesorhizobium sp. M4A.F.Ca.ET.022.05.2.1]|uniref:DUF1349 domain-containing protein n=1 Tax=Mesorhizobium sp. M4A.F.Ca.ET.022.05.2.1 TaxID=2496653 RepID=UPI001FE0EA74|nr:DUF1349 domain-containing protein [Mesorhizobium sp. M4A.F.Ca.ET.022.05.2.1]